MSTDNLLFTKTHEWVKMENNSAIIGITDYAQHHLGDVVFIELPQIGNSIKQFESFGTIESTKAASDLYAPLSGEIIEANTKLQENPGLINNDPYGEGWIIKIKITDKEETKNLLGPEEYESFLKEENQ